MSTTTPSEIWNDILKGNVEKEDPLWTLYLDKAAVFDTRMVDEWNKIVDVLLVYVALFISVLTAFIIQTFAQFQPNPADITNNLLVAIYDQLVAQSNNTSIPPVDPRSYFQQSKADYDAAFTQNALLYSSLSLSITVSVIALAAKLWLVSYSRQAFSVGLPYDRAMKRQEAYNGLLLWNMGGVINMLPVILLIALFLFEIYVYMSVSAIQNVIGLIVGALLNAGVMFLGFTSLGGALVSGCPFRSSFSSVIRHIFEKARTLFKKIGFLSMNWGIVRGAIGLLFFAFQIVLIVFASETALTTGAWFSLVFPFAIPIAWSAQEEAVHKPQKYRIPHLALWLSLTVSLLVIFSMCFGIAALILLELTAVMVTLRTCLVILKMAKSMADTGEIDAIAWLLTTTPPQYPATLFKKAGQMTGSESIGRHYRPRLLESLMPFLTLLTSSHLAPEHPSSDTHSPSSSGSSDEDPRLKNIEIYIACLARLSEFTDSEGNGICLWEDAMKHPKLEQALIDKLVVYANPQHHFPDVLRSAATKVLNNFKLDMEGNPVGRGEGVSPATGGWGVFTILRSAVSSVATVLRGAASLLKTNSQEERGHSNLSVELELASHVEPSHSSGEIEEA